MLPPNSGVIYNVGSLGVIMLCLGVKSLIDSCFYFDLPGTLFLRAVRVHSFMCNERPLGTLVV